MLGPVPFAHQPGADDRVARIADDRAPDLLALDLVGQGVEQLGGRATQPAEGQS
jgi:hypothetical protein